MPKTSHTFPINGNNNAARHEGFRGSTSPKFHQTNEESACITTMSLKKNAQPHFTLTTLGRSQNTGRFSRLAAHLRNLFQSPENSAHVPSHPCRDRQNSFSRQSARKHYAATQKRNKITRNAVESPKSELRAIHFDDLWHVHMHIGQQQNNLAH